jgi:hypothetical protein
MNAMTDEIGSIYTSEQINQIKIQIPESVKNARIEAFDRAGYPETICEVNSPECLQKGSIAHQKESRYGFFGHRQSDVVQTSDNYVICCPLCHSWIHNNVQQSVELGFLHQSWADGFDDSLDHDAIREALRNIN